jgi:hypothetical protein
VAINIGSVAVEAIKELKDSAHLGRLIDALGQIAQKRALAALSAPAEQRIAQTSHAHGVWETYEALKAAYEGVLPSQVSLPALPPTVGAAARARATKTNEVDLNALG